MAARGFFAQFSRVVKFRQKRLHANEHICIYSTNNRYASLSGLI